MFHPVSTFGSGAMRRTCPPLIVASEAWAVEPQLIIAIAPTSPWGIVPAVR